MVCILNESNSFCFWFVFRFHLSLNLILMRTHANVHEQTGNKMLDFMERNFTCSVDNLRAGRLHTLVTSAFSHNDVGSLLATLNSVFSCGLPVAQMSGSGAFARLLLASSATSMLALVGSDWLRARRAQTAARREWWRPPVDPFHDTSLCLLLLLISLFLMLFSLPLTNTSNRNDT